MLSCPRMCDAIAKLLRSATAWADGCSCHAHLLGLGPDEVHPKVYKQWLECPMKGMRAAELSAGEFLEVFCGICNQTAAAMMLSLPADISAQERTALLKEYDAGASHVTFYFVLKLSHFGETPWLLFQLAHHDSTVAHAALRECLASNDQHPCMQRFRSPPLREQALQWVEGADLFAPQLKDLCCFVAKMRFAMTSERSAEGQHAKTMVQGRGKPLHSVTYQSYHLRVHEMQAAVRAQPDLVQTFAYLAGLARNSKSAVLATGLEIHPLCIQDDRAERKERDPALRELIYHADSFTLYTAAPPHVRMRPASDPFDPGDAGDRPPHGVLP
jgi:hypothetical protein